MAPLFTRKGNPMLKSTHYFDWDNMAAVVGEVNETESTGFYQNADNSV